MIYAIINEKGGVGKTTSTINISSILAEMGKKVLIIDTDPQGNLSTGIGFEKNKTEVTIFDVLVNETPITESIYKTKIENVHILPATLKLSNAEVMLSGMMERETRLRSAIEEYELKNFYDYILIDTPPSVGLLTQNAIVATDRILVPVHTSTYDVEGITHLFSLVNRIKRNLNKELEVFGSFISSVDKRRNIIKYKKELDNFFEGKTFSTIIHQYAVVESATNNFLPINKYDKNSKANKEWELLVKEFIKKEKSVAL